MSYLIPDEGNVTNGTTYFVNKDGSDSNSGLIRALAKVTIQAADTLAVDGDTIVIGVGYYEENMGIAQDGITIIFEPGAHLGGQLLVPGSYNMILGGHYTAQDTNPAIILTGNRNHLKNPLADGGSEYAIAISGGTYNTIEDATAQAYTVGGFLITSSSSRNRVYNSNAIAVISDTGTYGFLVGSTSHYNIYKGCSSVNNDSGAYSFSSDALYNLVEDLNSGYGDQLLNDRGSNDVVNHNYDCCVNKSITFTDATQAFDLFTVTGTVELELLNGHVSTVLNAEMGNCKFRVYGTDGTTDLDITTASSLNSLPVGSYLGKTAATSVALTVGSSAAPVIIENADVKKPDIGFLLVADNTGTTTIQLYSDDAAGNKTGAIHFHCKFRPITEDGNIVPA